MSADTKSTKRGMAICECSSAKHMTGKDTVAGGKWGKTDGIDESRQKSKPSGAKMNISADNKYNMKGGERLILLGKEACSWFRHQGARFLMEEHTQKE